MEVVGSREGWKGLVAVEPEDPEALKRWTMPLDELIVRTWDRQGGTALGSSRTNPFKPKNEQSEWGVANIEKLGLDALVAIGGEDTLSVAYKLHNLGQKVVGMPQDHRP